MCQDIEFNYNDIILKKSDSRFVDSIFNYLFTLKDKYYSFEDENRLLLGLDVYRKRNLKNIKMIDSKGFKVMLPFGLIRGVVMGANASGLLHEQLKKITNRMRLPLYQYRSDVVLV